MGVSKKNNHIQIEIQSPSQQSPGSSTDPNQNLKDMYVLCTFEMKGAKILINGVSKTSDHIQIKINIQNPSQKPQALSKAVNQELKLT